MYSSLTNTSDEFKEKPTDYQTYSPERKFYYPSQITPLKTTLSIGGTIYEYPATTTKTSKKTALSISLIAPEDLATDAEAGGEASKAATSESEDSDESADDETATDAETDGDEEERENATEADADGESEAGEASDGDSASTALAEAATAESEAATDIQFAETALPLIATTVPSSTTIAGLSYKLAYTISPTFTSQFTYSSTNLKAPEDFDWNDMQATYYQVKSPTVLTSTLGWRGSFITLTDTVTFSPVYQEHPYLKAAELDEKGKESTANGGYTQSSINSLKKADYNARKLDVTDVNALSFRPFYYTDHFSDTALTWNTTVQLIRTQYISDDVENPEWEYLTADFEDEECVTVHNLNLVLAAKEFDGKLGQQLSLTTTLPPQVDAYSGVLTLTFPYTTFSCGTGIHQKSSTDDTWVKDDFSQSLSVSLFSSKLKFTQSYIYDFEEEEHESFKLALSGYGAQLAYTMSYTTGYDFQDDYTDSNGVMHYGGWVSRSEKEFQPYSLSLAYASGTKTWTRWSDRISLSPSLSTSVVYDCLRPTNSYFTFIPAVTFKVNDFLNIKFSSETRNSVIFRYFQDYTGMNIDLPGEKSILQDLLNSFDFSDETKRKSSGFKLKSLNVTVTHDLDDWDFAASFSVKPRLTTDSDNKSYYDFSPYFSISVAWRPMSGMKTEIVDEYGDWELNP